MKRTSRTSLLLAAALFLPITSGHALTPRQERMKTCNAEATAKGLKGADRKTFMKRCLANAPAKPAEAPAVAPGAAPSPPPAVPAPPVPTPQTVPAEGGRAG
jgi:hypothetical protein